MKDWRTQEHVGLKVEVDGHTAVVTLNNPPAHTWTVHSLSRCATWSARSTQTAASTRW